MNKKALITGIAGQDGWYLSRLLLEKNYSVFGVVRDLSKTFEVPQGVNLIQGNLEDKESIAVILNRVKPDEVYNLAAQSHIPSSFLDPKSTFAVNYFGAGLVISSSFSANKEALVYQASSCEMFGSSPPPQDEDTPFCPLNPYAESKVRAHEDFVVHYRKMGYYACSGILFHHESERRNERFVSKKIVSSLVEIKAGIRTRFELGNLSAKVDWGYAGDYVKAMWLMLQQDQPEDFVIASGESHSVREFVSTAARLLDIELLWEGNGYDEIARNKKGDILVSVNKEYYRLADPAHFQGNIKKAKEKLGWQPSVSFAELVKIMVDNEKKRFSL